MGEGSRLLLLGVADWHSGCKRGEGDREKGRDGERERGRGAAREREREGERERWREGEREKERDGEREIGREGECEESPHTFLCLIMHGIFQTVEFAHGGIHCEGECEGGGRRMPRCLEVTE